MKNKDEILRIIREAKNLLRGNWTRGSWERDGRYCVNGALNVAGGHIHGTLGGPVTDTYISEQIGFEDYVYKTKNVDSVEWNDNHTELGVIRLLSQYEKSVLAHEYED